MSNSKIHDSRKVKNYLVFGLLLLFVIFVFAITIVKLHIASEATGGIDIEALK